MSFINLLPNRIDIYKQLKVRLSSDLSLNSFLGKYPLT